MAKTIDVEDESLVAGALVGRQQAFVVSDRLLREAWFRTDEPDVNVVPRQVAGLRRDGWGTANQRAAVIELTWMVLVFASSVPTTATCWPANFSGVRWSLSV